MKSFPRTHWCLALLACLAAFSAARAATPPQYILDPSFTAPLFTARSFALRTFVLPDDRFFVAGGTGAGAIHRINGEQRGSFFRFSPNGTLDNTFVLDPQLRDFSVTTAAPAPGDKVYVVCVPPAFIGGPDRIFRLNSDGSLDSSFDAGAGTTPNAAGIRRIRAILVDASERVIVAGQFGDFSEHGRPNLLRLTSSGALDQSFAAVTLGGSTGASLSPNSHMGIALQPDGKLIITGTFTSVNGVARHQLARLNNDGSVDSGFVPAGYTSASAIMCVAVQVDGKVLLGGRFRIQGNNQSFNLFRVNDTGSRDNGFTLPTGSAFVRALEFTAFGSILVATNSGLPRLYASDGVPVGTFSASQPTFGEDAPSLYSVDRQSDGRIIFSGTFQTLNNEEYPGLARLQPNGALDSTFRHATRLERDTLPAKMAARPDGKIMVSGDFEWVNGIPRFGTALLNEDGSVSGVSFPFFGIYFPGTFVPPSFIALPNNQVLLFGQTEIDNNGFWDCLRLNANGSEDSSFAFEDNSFEVSHVLRDDGGNYVLSTGFSAQSVVNRIFLSRAFSSGMLDDSFLFGVDLVERNADGTLRKLYVGENRALATLPGGEVLFKYFDGVDYHLLRLQSDSFPDESFNEGTAAPKATFVTFPSVFDPYDPRGGVTVQPPNGAVEPTSLGPTCVLSLADGRMILGGEFVSYNGQSASGIVQLSSDGALLSTFGSGVAFAAAPANTQREPSITALELESTGRILAVGDFDRYNGAPAPGMVRIDADGNRDSSFALPLVPRSSGTAFTETPLLAREAGGSFLVVGNYGTTPGASVATSIFRLVAVPVAVSRKTHGDAGSFDVNLPFSGDAGIEPRSGGAGGNHQIVVTFPAAVTFAGVSVTNGTGSVASASGNGTDVLTIDLTGVANQQTVSVTLAGVNDGATTKDIVVRMSALVGDSNGSGVVNSGDALQTRTRSGQPTDATNYRSDFNTDGNVNSGDASVAKARSGDSL